MPSRSSVRLIVRTAASMASLPASMLDGCQNRIETSTPCLRLRARIEPTRVISSGAPRASRNTISTWSMSVSNPSVTSTDERSVPSIVIRRPHCGPWSGWDVAITSGQVGRLSGRCLEWTTGSRQVDDDGDRLSDLRQSERAHVAENFDGSCRRNGSDVLTLRGRRLLESVGFVLLDHDLAVKASKRAGQRYDLDHGWFGVENALSGDDDGRVEVSGFSSCRLAQVEADDVTRALHRAMTSRRR